VSEDHSSRACAHPSAAGSDQAAAEERSAHPRSAAWQTSYQREKVRHEADAQSWATRNKRILACSIPVQGSEGRRVGRRSLEDAQPLLGTLRPDNRPLHPGTCWTASFDLLGKIVEPWPTWSYLRARSSKTSTARRLGRIARARPYCGTDGHNSTMSHRGRRQRVPRERDIALSLVWNVTRKGVQLRVRYDSLTRLCKMAMDGMWRVCHRWLCAFWQQSPGTDGE